MDIYEKVRNEIMTMRIDKKSNGNNTYTKLYKPLLILSMLDYYDDIGVESKAFNNATSVDNLVDFFTIYLENQLIKTETYNGSTNIMNPKNILRLIREHPLYHITRTNKNEKSDVFLNNLPNNLEKKPRSNSKMATTFEIRVPVDCDLSKMCLVIRSACIERIKKETGIILSDSVSHDLAGKPEKTSTYFRQGQAQYRRKMLEKYEYKCAFCGFDVEHTLISSHAKPWRKCKTVNEKLSDNNGFLLCANHDKMFDRGYLTIDVETNEFIYSELLAENEIITCRNTLPEHFNYELNNEMKVYMKYHIDNVFR